MNHPDPHRLALIHARGYIQGAAAYLRTRDAAKSADMMNYARQLRELLEDNDPHTETSTRTRSGSVSPGRTDNNTPAGRRFGGRLMWQLHRFLVETSARLRGWADEPEPDAMRNHAEWSADLERAVKEQEADRVA